MVDPIMKFLITAACFFSLLFHAAWAGPVPTLVFEADPDAEITWKQVFDSGFRPKHLGGLEGSKCVSEGQPMGVKLQQDGPAFEVTAGRIRFAMVEGTRLTVIWHQGSDAITMREGEDQVARFKAVFGSSVVQEIKMPRRIDPSGLVDAGNEENDIRARVGRYLIYYGFDNSFRADKPIIPHFYIALNYPGIPQHKVNRGAYKIPPPEGYEWYSLDPAIDTPSPGVRNPVPVLPAATPQSEGPSLPRALAAVAARVESGFPWRVGLAIVVVISVVTGIILSKMKSRRRNK